MFGLAGCLAVCLQSSYTGHDDYILEFFLPPDCREDGEQKALLESILALMKQCVGSLKVVVDGDLREVSLQVSDVNVIENEDLDDTDTQNPESRHCESPGYSTHDRMAVEVSENGSREVSNPNLLGDESYQKYNGTLVGKGNGIDTCNSLVFDNRSPQRMRGNTGDAASIDVDSVQQHLPGRLPNAAESRARSEVWQHFTKAGARAYCRYCSKDYAAESRKNGTSRQRRLLTGVHKVNLASFSQEGN